MFHPFFGNTKQLRAEARRLGGQHLVFEEWSRKYNSPILGLKLGSANYVIVLSHKYVREVHSREEFDGRPDNFFLRLRTMGARLGVTCVDGHMWAEQRNFVTRHLREAGYGRQAMDAQIETELGELVDHLRGKEAQRQGIWPGALFPVSVLNVLWQFTAGYRLHRDDDRLIRVLTLLRERSKAFDMSGGILSQMPWIRYVVPDWSGYNLIKRFNAQLSQFFMEIIRDHHDNFTEDKQTDDLIYAFINEMQRNADKPQSNFTGMNRDGEEGIIHNQ